jgi:hypothetical protein
MSVRDNPDWVRDRIDLATALLALGYAHPDPRIDAEPVSVVDIRGRGEHRFAGVARALTIKEADSVLSVWRS